MTFKPGTPTTQDVAIPQTKDLDTLRVFEVHTRLDPNNPMTNHSVVVFKEGYIDGAAFIGVNNFRKRLEGVSYLGEVTRQVVQNDPPGSPKLSQPFVVGAAPTGAWVGHECELAIWNGTGWDFMPLTQYDLIKASTWYQLHEGEHVPDGTVE